VASLLLASSIAFMMMLIAYVKSYSEIAPDLHWVAIYCVFAFVFFFCLNQGNWVFCLQYNSVPRTVQIVLRNDTKQEEFQTKMINIVFTCLNFIFAGMYSVAYALNIYFTEQFTPKSKKVASRFNEVAVIGNFMIQLVIAFFLARALYNMRQLAQKNSSEINVKFALIHLIAFVLFIISAIIEITFFLGYLDNDQNEK
jgi:hypothetical protein